MFDIKYKYDDETEIAYVRYKFVNILIKNIFKLVYYILFVVRNNSLY